ncbi:hypothetical protein FGO68_gene5495 [Halteria grandinella]|uniref:Uncharacterized protein n=1 Tax=Halteria grandinella TaxID=5974 RepID=A0A8J8NJV3_HALGN|nr:hypothetical protein FGO68_gene5495 [Halteria grandinella]
MNTLPSQPQHYSQDPLQQSQGDSSYEYSNLIINRNPPLPAIISAQSEPLSTTQCKRIYLKLPITALHASPHSAPNSPTNSPLPSSQQLFPSSQASSSLPHHESPRLNSITLSTDQQNIPMTAPITFPQSDLEVFILSLSPNFNELHTVVQRVLRDISSRFQQSLQQADDYGIEIQRLRTASLSVRDYQALSEYESAVDRLCDKFMELVRDLHRMKKEVRLCERLIDLLTQVYVSLQSKSTLYFAF